MASDDSTGAGFSSNAGSQSFSPNTQGGLPPSKRSNPLDIDSEGYHAELAFNLMSKELSLPDMIRKYNQIVSEIKDLDGGMKTLVYENYSKFIAATETIRKMKSNSEEMESQISLLEKKITEITVSADAIHTSLAPQRAKIHQLNGVHNLVRKIEDECSLIMQGVARRVRDKMMSDKSNVRQISENVGLMLGLGAVAPLDLARDYILRVSVQMNRLLDAEAAELTAQKATPESITVPQDTNPGSSAQIDTLEGLKASISAKGMLDEERDSAQKEFLKFIEQMENRYFDLIEKVLQLPNDISQASPTLYVRVLQVIRNDIAEATTLSTLTSMDQRVNEMAASILDKIISGVFGKVRHEFTSRWKDIQVGPSLDIFTVVRQLTGWIKETLIAHALPILENFVNPESTQHMGGGIEIDSIVVRIRDTLLSFWTEIGNDMLTATGDLSMVAPGHILILSRLALLWSSGSIESVFSMYAERILAAGSLYSPTAGTGRQPSPKRSKSPSAAAAPTLSPETDLMAKARDIAQNYNVLSQSLLKRFVEHSVGRVTHRIAAHVESLVATDTVTAAVESGHGALEDETAPSPREVSAVWIELSKEFEVLQADVRKCFAEEASTIDNRRKSGMIMSPSNSSMSSNLSIGSPSSTLARNATMRMPSAASNSKPALSSAPRVPSNLAAPRFDALLNDIDRLFAERIEYLPHRIELAYPAVMATIAKMMVKADGIDLHVIRLFNTIDSKCFCELLRPVVIGPTAYQQIQIDMAYVKAQFWMYVPDERIIITLVDTCLQSALERCVGEPEPMDTFLVDRIVSLFVK
eukprot:jgi/Hompol1/5702/HPOL_004640-RA